MCSMYSKTKPEVTVKIVNEGTGLVLPAFYTFTYGQKYTRTDISETFNFLRFLLSLNLEKNVGVRLLGHVH